MRENIELNIVNTLTRDVNINLLGQKDDPGSYVNATTRGHWDITAETFITGSPPVTVAVFFRAANQNTLQQSNFIDLPSPDANGVVNALNTLGLGTFEKVISGPNTFIEIFNPAFVFGDLTISDHS